MGAICSVVIVVQSVHLEHILFSIRKSQILQVQLSMVVVTACVALKLSSFDPYLFSCSAHFIISKLCYSFRAV